MTDQPLNPEEKFNQDVWWILQEIRKDELLTPKGEEVEFRIRAQPKISSRAKQVNTPNFPAEDTQRKLLYKLKEWQAIDLVPVNDLWSGSDIFNPTIYRLAIKRPQFDERYSFYESSFKRDETLEILQPKFNETHHRFERSFSFEKEKGKIRVITDTADHKLAKERWINIKRVLDAMYQMMSPLDMGKPLFFSSDFTKLPEEQKAVLSSVLRDMFLSGVAGHNSNNSAAMSNEPVVMSSEPVRKFLQGENVLIKDRDKFEDYRNRISQLCQFIEEDGKKRFPEIYLSVPITSSISANKKKLCILEKLKDEFDLTPTTPVRTHLYFGYSHVRPAGEASLYGQKLLAWIQECNLNDRLQLENVLAIFQQESLISKFIFSEQEGDLKIQFPEDFIERYEEYKAKLLTLPHAMASSNAHQLKPAIEEDFQNDPQRKLVIEQDGTESIMEREQERGEQQKPFVKKLTIIESEQARFKIIVNDDYEKPIRVDTARPTWELLYKVAEGERPNAADHKSSIDYLNTNKKCSLYTQTGCSVTKILETVDGQVVPTITLEMISEQAFQKRKNKSRKRT